MTKFLEKYLTRDVPLILIEAWYQGRVKYFKEFFGIPFPSTVFLSSNGVFEFYVDLADFDNKFPKKLSVWSSIQKNRKKLTSVSQYMREGLDYFRQIKLDATPLELIDYLMKTNNLLARGYRGVLVTHHFPRWHYQFKNEDQKLFGDSLIKEIMKWRQQEGNIFMDEGANTVYALLNEIAKRKKWDPGLLKYITLKELSNAVRGWKPLPIRRLKQRQNSRFVFLDAQIIYESDFKQKFKINQFQLKGDAVLDKTIYIRGSVANLGYAKGLVRVIFNRQQLPLVKEGEVLVAPMTAPWYLPAMKKSSAIVTDEGGVASHAAIISREIDKPCIVGTKIATKVLKDGDRVEVDANKGIVRRISR